LPPSRDFAQGYLETNLPAEPFASVPRLLAGSARLFFGNLPRIAAITLLVFLPGKFALQLLCSALDVPENGPLSYGISALSDLILGALAAPAVVAQLLGRPMGLSLRWGRRMWAKSLWNAIKMQVTVVLWGLLLIVPGVVAAVRLVFTDVIVAVEADRTGDVLGRSRELSKGHGWRIFLVIAVLGLIDLLAWGGVLRLHLGMALTDSLLAVVSQWSLAAALLMYLGITRASVQP
jgi:hypothetical protein